MKKYSIISYSLENLQSLLFKQEAPVMESALISMLAREYNYPRLLRKYLYEFHFSLYHALYRIKIQSTDSYLHIDPMRIRLIKLPGKNECAFYDETAGEFCRQSTDLYFCPCHGKSNDMSYPVIDIMKGFYLDAHNIEFGKTCDLEKSMRTILSYGFNKREVDSALEFFNIAYPDLPLIRKRYREYALKYHPDTQGNGEMMKLVNRYYTILKSLF